MPQVSITKELGIAIKELRVANKVKSKDISTAIQKSPTYISKLEHGEIQKIDYDDLMNIFHAIFPNKQTFSIKFEEFIGKCSLKFTEKERKRQIWIQNFDTVYRKIPIPSELVDYCNEEISKANTSVAEVVARVNLNEELSNKDFSKYKKNIVYMENDEVFVIMNVSLDYMQKILNKEIDITNYITMESFVFNLLKFIIPDFTQAHKKAIEVLTSYKFYSILEKQKKLENTHTSDEIEAILTDFDKVNQKVMQKINHHIHEFSELNIKYTNEKLLALSNNFDTDPSLSIAYLGIDLSKLKNLDVTMKRNLLIDIKQLVDEYSKKAPEEKKITLL